VSKRQYIHYSGDEFLPKLYSYNLINIWITLFSEPMDRMRQQMQTEHIMVAIGGISCRMGEKERLSNAPCGN